MAAVKSNKTTTKLKAGKKKPLNKWIVVGGIAAVAIVGALVVRFSGASNWTTITSQKFGYSASSFDATSATKSLANGKTYRICFNGKSNGSNSNVVFQPQAFYTKKPTNSTMTLRCSKSYTAKYVGTSKFTPYISVPPSGPTIYVKDILFQRMN